MGRFNGNYNESYNQQGNEVAVSDKPMTQADKVIAFKKFAFKPSMQQRFNDVLGDKAPAFLAGVISATNTNPKLLDAQPATVMGAAMIAASLNLSVVPTLGQAAIVPYGGNAQFQIMTRGIIQLAQRTGLYKCINTGDVYADEYDGEDLLTGDVTFHRVHGGYRDQGRTEMIIGYFAHIETTTGFAKTEYWTKEDVINHALRFSKSRTKSGELIGVWKDSFDAMARKTVLKSLINHYGPMSVDTQLAQAITKDQMVVDNEGNESYADNPMDDLIVANTFTDEEESPVNASCEEKRESVPTQEKNALQSEESTSEKKTASDDDEEMNF